MKDSNNPDLRARVLRKELLPDDLVRMSAHELASKVAPLPFVFSVERYCLLRVGAAGSCPCKQVSQPQLAPWRDWLWTLILQIEGLPAAARSEWCMLLLWVFTVEATCSIHRRPGSVSVCYSKTCILMIGGWLLTKAMQRTCPRQI